MYRLHLTAAHSHGTFDDHGRRHGAGVPFPTAEIRLEGVSAEAIETLRALEDPDVQLAYLEGLPQWAHKHFTPETVTDADIEMIAIASVERITPTG